jgi:hypothetical protein
LLYIKLTPLLNVQLSGKPEKRSLKTQFANRDGHRRATNAKNHQISVNITKYHQELKIMEPQPALKKTEPESTAPNGTQRHYKKILRTPTTVSIRVDSCRFVSIPAIVNDS